MTVHEVLQACRLVKEIGNSKVPLPTKVVEQLCRDALMWRNAPPMVREAIEKVQE